MSGLGPAYPGGAPYTRGSDTSEAAARAISQERLTDLQERVLSALRAVRSEGLTADEVAEKLGQYRYTVATRLTELVRLGWADDSHQRRPTPRGGSAIVYVARLERRPPAPRRPTRFQQLEQRIGALEKRLAELLAKPGQPNQGRLF